MEAFERADYAPSQAPELGAWVESIEEGSPAARAGIERGMRIVSVNGAPLRDLIDWRWEADGAVCELEVERKDGSVFTAELVRSFGEDWGVDFTDVIFDGIRTCVNACQFCFMSMLPEDMRPSLSLRDDDYRLSFLQGNFVTLTNVSDEDAERIIECDLEPMNVSLHAISPEVRRSLIGARAQRGIEVLERLLDAGIEVHGQIVLCPGINDGDELERTLAWVEERPLIRSIALVPVGYTRYSRRFTSSYSDDPASARAVVELVGPYQERSRARDGITRFQLSDEFYVAAGMEVPPSDDYDGYPQFHDGIGMLRSFLDEAALVCAERRDELEQVASSLRADGRRALLICGEAAHETIGAFCRLWAPTGEIEARSIRNDFFGGDVNVTGLIVAEDLLAQLPEDLTRTICVLPEPMFNFDKVTLDGMELADLSNALEARGATVATSLPNPGDYLDALLAL